MNVPPCVYTYTLNEKCTGETIIFRLDDFFADMPLILFYAFVIDIFYGVGKP